jgi:hypothetical protein
MATTRDGIDGIKSLPSAHRPATLPHLAQRIRALFFVLVKFSSMGKRVIPQLRK